MGPKVAGDKRVSPREAVAIARSHPDLKRVLEGRAQTLFVEPVSPHRRAGTEEHVLLGLYDYRGDRPLLALIDHARRTVVSLHESPVHFQLAADERVEAERIAGTNEAVRAFLRGRPMQPLTRLYLPRPDRPDAGHRLAIVFLRPTPQDRAYAIVDLSDARVVEVISRAAFTGERP